MALTYLNNDTFNEFLSTDKPVMIFFGAEWCGPCRMATPQIEILAQNEDFKVAKVEMDDNEELAKQYEVQKIPTFIFFKNGEEFDRMKPGDIRRSVMTEKLKALV